MSQIHSTKKGSLRQRFEPPQGLKVSAAIGGYLRDGRETAEDANEAL